MSSIQQVLNSVDMRRKIFNFKSQSIKTTTKNNFNLVIDELNECFNRVIENSIDYNGEPINDYVELENSLRVDIYFTAFYWLMEEIISIKLLKKHFN